MRSQTYTNVHVFANLTVLLLLEAAAGVAIWRLVPTFFGWFVIFFFVFWVIAYLGHRLIPKLTGPAVDYFFKDKIDNNQGSETTNNSSTGD